MRLVFDIDPRTVTVALGANRRQTPSYDKYVEHRTSCVAQENVYLHKCFRRRESPRPEEVHGNDMFQRALGLFRCEKRFIGRQGRRKPLRQSAVVPQFELQAHLIQCLPVSCQTIIDFLLPFIDLLLRRLYIPREHCQLGLRGKTSREPFLLYVQGLEKRVKRVLYGRGLAFTHGRFI
jgi:hypothetical protein